jgi:hypothetical protein
MKQVGVAVELFSCIQKISIRNSAALQAILTEVLHSFPLSVG